MDCPRCGQGNIPGSAACFGCGAALAEPPAREPTYPPRAERSGLRESLARKRPDPHRRFYWNRVPVRDLLLPYLVRGWASLLPGLGQCLNRQWLKAIAFFLAAAWLVLLLLSGWLDVNLGFALVLGLGLVLAAVIDAAWFATPKELRESLTWRHRFGLGALLASVILTLASMSFLIINSSFVFFQPYNDFPTLSLKRGETLVAWRSPAVIDWPGRGDIVVLGPRGGQIGLLIALPGDRVVVEDGRILVNGKPLSLKLLPNLDRNRRQVLVPENSEAVVLVYQFGENGLLAPQLQLVSRSGYVSRIIGVILPFGHRRSLGGVF